MFLSFPPLFFPLVFGCLYVNEHERTLERPTEAEDMHVEIEARLRRIGLWSCEVFIKSEVSKTRIVLLIKLYYPGRASRCGSTKRILMKKGGRNGNWRIA